MRIYRMALSTKSAVTSVAACLMAASLPLAALAQLGQSDLVVPGSPDAVDSMPQTDGGASYPTSESWMKQMSTQLNMPSGNGASAQPASGMGQSSSQAPSGQWMIPLDQMNNQGESSDAFSQGKPQATDANGGWANVPRQPVQSSAVPKSATGAQSAAAAAQNSVSAKSASGAVGSAKSTKAATAKVPAGKVTASAVKSALKPASKMPLASGNLRQLKPVGDNSVPHNNPVSGEVSISTQAGGDANSMGSMNGMNSMNSGMSGMNGMSSMNGMNSGTSGMNGMSSMNGMNSGMSGMGAMNSMNSGMSGINGMGAMNSMNSGMSGMGSMAGMSGLGGLAGMAAGMAGMGGGSAGGSPLDNIGKMIAGAANSGLIPGGDAQGMPNVPGAASGYPSSGGGYSNTGYGGGPVYSQPPPRIQGIPLNRVPGSYTMRRVNNAFQRNIDQAVTQTISRGLNRLLNRY